jgi:hypothetical protein
MPQSRVKPSTYWIQVFGVTYKLTCYVIIVINLMEVSYFFVRLFLSYSRISGIVWNPRSYLLVYKMDFILSRMDPIHTLNSISVRSTFI